MRDPRKKMVKYSVASLCQAVESFSWHDSDLSGNEQEGGKVERKGEAGSLLPPGEWKNSTKRVPEQARERR